MDLSWTSLKGKLDPRILRIVRKSFKFDKMTPVQAATIPLFLGNKDVTVEAVTGSGKTLAFVLPLLQVVLRKGDEMRRVKDGEPLDKHDVLCLVISPTRELASQIFDVLNEFLQHESLANDIKGLLFVGGSNPFADEQKFSEDGANIIVSTPGRLADLLDRSQLMSSRIRKYLEVFILDEADQLLAMGFEKTLNLILARLPKQRRTGLFSATQTKQLEHLIRAGLRNPVKIEIKAKQKAGNVTASGASTSSDSKACDAMTEGSDLQSTGLQMSPYLSNNYIILNKYSEKIAATIKFIAQHPKEKFLVFFSTCAQVDYFSKCLEHFLKKEAPTLVSFSKMHRKLKKKRQKIFDRYKDLEEGSGAVLLCTDVLSRGVDFPNVDWVLHFDLPNTLQHYIHRSGRSGHQVGQHGNSLLLLLAHEMPFVDLCRQKGIQLKLLESAFVLDNDANDTIVTWIKSEARKNASYYEMGMKAFVSFVRTYSSSNVLSQTLFEGLDVIELVNSYGLLKIPIMPELRGKLRSCPTTFNKSKGDKELAVQHKEKLDAARPVKEESEATLERRNIKQMLKVKRQRMRNKINTTKLKGKRKKELIDDLELDELCEDARVVKKLKKGKISHKQFEEHFGV